MLNLTSVNHWRDPAHFRATSRTATGCLRRAPRTFRQHSARRWFTNPHHFALLLVPPPEQDPRTGAYSTTPAHGQATERRISNWTRGFSNVVIQAHSALQDHRLQARFARVSLPVPA